MRVVEVHAQDRDPVARLLVAIVRRALDDSRLCSVSVGGTQQWSSHFRQAIQRDALAWLSAHDPDRPLSFESICLHLGVSPAPIRLALRADTRRPQLPLPIHTHIHGGPHGTTSDD